VHRADADNARTGLRPGALAWRKRAHGQHDRESTRQLIADRIKTGAALEGASATLPDQAKTTPDRGKDRSR
jgi:hypothetical protein